MELSQDIYECASCGFSLSQKKPYAKRYNEELGRNEFLCPTCIILYRNVGLNYRYYPGFTEGTKEIPQKTMYPWEIVKPKRT